MWYQVSYVLLVFFVGMFITVDGFNKTGIPSTFWDVVEPHARTNSASGILVLSLVVIILSNIASNVPTGESFYIVLIIKYGLGDIHANQIVNFWNLEIYGLFAFTLL